MTSYAEDDISSYLIGDMIKVYVGPKRKRYSIHKPLLTQYEWFSRKIYYDDGGSLSRDHLNLPIEDPKAFELFISWLYRRKLKAISTDPENEDVAKDEAALYVDLYLRAYAWEIHELQNELIDRLRLRKTCVYGYFPTQLIASIYANMEWTSSPLRSYVVDSFIFKGISWNGSTWFEDSSLMSRKLALKTQLDAGNHDFVLDCYEALYQLCAKSKILDPDLKTGCAYHVHYHGPCA